MGNSRIKNAKMKIFMSNIDQGQILPYGLTMSVSRPFRQALALGKRFMYSLEMQATVTEAFLEGIPELIRQRLHLVPGTIMEFDEEAPFLKAVPLGQKDSDETSRFYGWLQSSVGLAKGKITTTGRMSETRGED